MQNYQVGKEFKREQDSRKKTNLFRQAKKYLGMPLQPYIFNL